MSYAAAFEDDMAGMDVDQLPPELREQAKKEKKSQGGYRYDSPADKQHIKRQRAAIWAWFRGLGGNLIKHGVNLTKVPLPVELCEPRSFLQRLTDSWSYTELIHAAAACSDPVERLKLVIAFAVGGMRQQVSCDKPFNPILGETLQGVFPCGCDVYAEQISHHPPVSCWQVRDHQGRFEYTGSSCWSATFTGNSVKGTQEGTSSVRFTSDGATITWTLPAIHIRGVLFGDRVVKYHDTITFGDAQNHLRCELCIDPHAPKKGILKRVITKARHPRHKHSHDQLVGDLVHIESDGREQVLDSCTGTWLTELSWDKGVRSTIMPAEATAAAEAAAAAAAADKHQTAEDTGSVICHSIGSFSTTSGSTISELGAAAEAEAAAAATDHNGKPHSSSDNEGGSSSSSRGSSSSTKLTARALAALTAKPRLTEATGNGTAGNTLAAETAAAAAAAAAAEVEVETAAAAAAAADVMPVVATASTLQGSDAAAHRSGRGISVVKRTWDVHSSQVVHVKPLAEDDPRLLPSDYRYRPDVLALAGGNSQAAQHWKFVLEERQRRDRALRGGDRQQRQQQRQQQHKRGSSLGQDTGEGAETDY